VKNPLGICQLKTKEYACLTESIEHESRIMCQMQARKALSGICFPKSISLGMQQSVRNIKKIKIKIRKVPQFSLFFYTKFGFQKFYFILFYFIFGA
jgi:hypothetical protein